MTGRGFGIAVVFDELLPSVVRELFALITHLGDAGFALAAAALLYWFADSKRGDQRGGDRDRGAFAVAAVLGAFALSLALKGLFALPRPPSEIHLGYADGYGFPSGHAITATVVWGLLTLVVERGTRRTRTLVAGVTVALVALSRVVLGVHYVADVLAGVGVAVAYLTVLVRATDWRPTPAFLVAGGLALAALATNGFTPDSVATVAGIAGAGATWITLDSTARGGAPQNRLSAGAAVAGLAALGVVGYAGNHLVASLLAVFVLNLVVPAGILALPLIVERVKSGRSASPT
ncbi:acid phosphatase [Halobacteriales archaeon SW_6_65_15]|nr:MAG: acid phosphatase [Halobacteriales archaeon SW_6_65_15]